MGTKSNSNSSSHSNKANDTNTRLVLNVYDLTPLNNYLYWFGLGVFHSGIEVHGKEYGFGAHDYSSSGVFQVEPRKCPGFMYRCSITLGQVNMHPSEFRTVVENLASEYHGDTYHLISKNCNHFTNDVSCRLIGKRIPGWVNRLARLGSLCSCLLPESVQVTTVKQVPEYHECSGSLTPTNCELAELDDDHEKRLLSPLAGKDDVSFVKETRVK
ncbi:deSI-like protein At4g17486 isoform X2 [Lotus japonicus]|uniref:deSI-like protein At4g17486 isoform X2 n=1 Tax=Lotus japonicus TaxID=34305 RepID=UPI00258F8564|nr:deSI-like protein At4g17486 isoform X2 [Lotus japonicus]